MPKIRLLLIDDHVLVREALREWLEGDGRFAVVGTASRGDEAIELAARLAPDIVLMDVSLPGMNAFEAAQRILQAHPEVRIVFLSAHVHDQDIAEALALGARGYVTKTDPPEILLSALGEVSAGWEFFSPAVQERVGFDFHGPRPDRPGQPRLSTLTTREREVLIHIAHGLAKKQIARVLHVSVKTVEKHADNLMAKLDVHDRVALTRFAIREGLTHA